MHIMQSPDVELVELPRRLPSSLHRDKLKEIGCFILEGLSEEEACILSGVSPSLFKELKQTHSVVAEYLMKKNIEFKRKHLAAIAGHRTDKNSMWMLENLRPEEFGKKKGGDTTVNVIGAIIKDIRSTSDGLSVTDVEAVAGKKRRSDITPESVLS